MAFENVMVRTSDGNQFGPASMPQVVQWYGEGRVPPDAVLIDVATGEERPLSAFPQLAVWPPPSVGGQAQPPLPPPISATDRLIPTKNPKALAAYYCGVFAIACGVVLGPIAIVLGVMGIRESKTLQVGKTHAIVGIVGGTIATLLWLVPIIAIIYSNATHQW